MPRLALLTIENLDNFVTDEVMVVDLLEKAGWQIDWIPWQKTGVDWNGYDLVIIRSTWDYQYHLEEFFDVLAQIEASQAKLANPLSVVKWNARKNYLIDLADKGVEIVPTLLTETPQKEGLIAAFEHFSTEELVIKPLVGATAFDTFRIPLTIGKAELASILETYQDRQGLLQPFQENIQREGEFSLVYFNKKFSHAFLKVAKKGDYRVQEEYGGEPHAIAPEEKLLQVGDQILALIPENLLYARVDLVRSDRGFALMELELIEPALYFRTHEKAVENFVEAIQNWMSA
ncbi:MAG: hypothetical protein H6581_04505 [Bacteroidia bacterium]|nr:hypothetical protein [Bacteroidia bacterium]